MHQSSLERSDSKLLEFQLLDYSNCFAQRPGLPEGLEFKVSIELTVKKNNSLLTLWQRGKHFTD